MSPTQQERSAFGELMRTLRQDKHWTLADVAEACREKGLKTSPNKLSAYELGTYAPRSAADVAVLDDVLDADGALLAALGLDKGASSGGAFADLVARVEALERAVGIGKPKLRGLPSAADTGRAKQSKGKQRSQRAKPISSFDPDD